MKRLYFLTTVLSISLILFSACSQKDSAAEFDQQAVDDSLIFTIIADDSTTVFDLLGENYQIDFVNTASGVFVKEIDSVKNSTTAFWLYSVNDSFPKVAADAYKIGDSDVVKWHFRKINQ